MGLITYVYRTDNNNYEEIFDDGICFFDQNGSLNDSFVKVHDLYEYLKEVNDDESIYIIDIPEDYLEVKKGGSKVVTPYPILFEREMYNPNDKAIDVYPVLVPCLISKMYNGSMGCFLNENYNPKYNPCGLKFSLEQLNNIRKNMGEKDYTRYKDRNNKGESKYLFSIDYASGLWNSLKTHYGIDNPTEPFAKKGDISRLKFKNSNVKKLKPKKNKKNRY